MVSKKKKLIQNFVQKQYFAKDFIYFFQHSNKL